MSVVNSNGKTQYTGFDFGATEPLTVRLRGLVHSYPKGSGIIKEYIQNADDAGARHVKIVMDYRTYPADNLPGVEMKQLMGPSILIFNDSKFTNADLEGIQKIGEGTKTWDAFKTGRFGLGFNASYNITDYPSFLTGNGIYFFDPHADVVAGANLRAPGHGWELNEQTWRDFGDMLKPFEVFGLEHEQDHYPYTVFRLPLRTEEQAKKSKIRNEVFTQADFMSITDELTTLGPELLLFLKHVIDIEISEIPTTYSEPQPILTVVTENPDEVIGNRSVLNHTLLTNPEDMLNQLRKETGELPSVAYQHQIKVTRGNTSTRQTWQVVSGLYVDSENEILNGMEAMLAAGEKAVPWAGAAALIRTNDQAPQDLITDIKGKLYCFLPLPQLTGLPVHLNAFFDIDSSRQGPTSDESLIGKDQVRVQWNKLLTEHALSQAYAELITVLAKQIGQTDPSLFYNYWPDPNTSSIPLLKNLSAYVFSKLQRRPVLRCAGETLWGCCEDIIIIPEHWADLREPLVLDRQPIPDPELPSKIVRGFANAGVTLSQLTPRQLRSWLRTYETINLPLADVARPCLRRRDWIEMLLRFCLSDGQKTDLCGVPLALLANGQLSVFGRFEVKKVYLASPSLQEIFLDYPEWFIDYEFAEVTGLSPIPDFGLEKMGTSDVIEKLKIVLKSDVDDTLPTWQPDGEGLPNAAWLTNVYMYLTERGRLGYELTKVDGLYLKQLPIVPDHLDRLHQMGKVSTPLLPPQGSETELVNAAKQFGIPIISGPDDLVGAIREFTGVFNDQFVWPLTAVRDFVDTLDAYSEQWSTKFDCYTRTTHGPILNFLDQEADDLKTYPDQIDKLKTLPILPTLSDHLVSASSENIYIPVGEEPPVTSETVILLQTGPRGRWITLLHTLSIPELDLPNIILEVLLPSYLSLSDSEKYKTLTYIRDNLSKAAAKFEKDNENTETIWDKVAAAPLILCTDGKYYPAKRIYHPDSEQVVRNVLGSEAPIPDLNRYEDKATWLKFFSALGMSNTPRPMDLVEYINQLTDRAETEGVDAVTGELLSAIEHIKSHWSDLAGEEAEVGSQKHVAQQFILALKQKAWLPAQRDEKNLSRYPGYDIPKNRLYKPGELYLPRHGHLVASQKPIARLPGREPSQNMREALGFPDPKDAIDVIIAHFDRLLELWHSEDHAQITTKEITTSLGQIYQAFGSFQDEPSIKKLQSHYQDTFCLWDPRTQKFWKPCHVFDVQVPFFEPRRVYIRLSQDNDARGYNALGRRKTPTIEDYIAFLEDLANEFDTKPLGECEIEQVLQVLTLLGRDLRAKGEYKTNLRVLTRDNFLIMASNVYVADAPWYVEKLGDASRIFLLHSQVTRDVIEVARISSLSQKVEEEILRQPTPTEDESANNWCQTWQDTLRSSEFQTGLVRLMYHFDKLFRSGDLDWLADTHIVAVSKIETKLSVDDIDLGTGDVEYYFDPGTSETACTIYLAKQQQRLMELFLANALNQQLDQAHLDDLSPLTAIFGVSPEKINDILNKLRIQKPQDAPPTEISPETPEEDDGFVFPGENVDTADEGTAEELHGREPDRRQPGQQPEADKEFAPDKTDESDVGESKEKLPQDALSDQPATEQPDQQPGKHDKKTHRAPTPGDRPKPRSRAISGEDKPDGADKNSRSRSSTLPKGQPHGLSYVIGGNEKDRQSASSSNGSSVDSEIKKTERKAVEIALAYEYTEGRHPVEKERTNKGYDIESYEPDSAAAILNRPGQKKLARIIEVKGTQRPWDHYGVYLTPAEMAEAKKRGDQYYLYVVEYALHPDHRKLHIIQNPAQKIREYRFDQGWIKLAQDSVADTVKLLRDGNRIKDTVNATNRAMVKWYNEARGFGVLDADDYLPDGLFFHISEVKGHNSVQIGDVFEFEIGQRRKGKGPCAVNLRRI